MSLSAQSQHLTDYLRHPDFEGKFDVIRSTHNIVFCGGSDMNLIAHRLRRLLISAIASENGLVLPVAISSHSFFNLAVKFKAAGQFFVGFDAHNSKIAFFHSS